MPTLKRITLPGQVYHVFTRSAEGRSLYRSEKDVVDLLARVESAATATRVNVYGWVLTPQRLHFLLRNGRGPLNLFVSRIVSGYAIAMNRRHDMKGSLFAGRYRSVLVEEDRYFMRVLGYIHTIPLREGLVDTVGELDCYSWSGHAALLNRRSFAWMDVNYVLEKFSGDKVQGRVLYSRLISDLAAKGSEVIELDGGGLLRSASVEGLGIACGHVGGHDPRTLGSARFTRTRLRRFEEMEDWTERMRREKEKALDTVISHVVDACGISVGTLFSRSKRQAICDARALVCYIGCFVIGLPYTSAAETLGISASGAYMAARRGKRLAAEYPELTEGMELPIS